MHETSRDRPIDEVELNRLLRRIDWRFLLPGGNVGRIVYSRADARLLSALRLMCEHVSHLSDASPPSADLAVLVDPDEGTLCAARSALREDGTCYIEWNSLSGGTLRVIRKKLENAGFYEAVCYWAWPIPRKSAPRFWVPLDSRAAQAHFLATRPIRHGLRNSVRRAQRFAWRLAFRYGARVPVCAVARKRPRSPGTATWDGMNLELAEHLKVAWVSDLKQPTRPDRLSWVLLTGGTASFNKLVGLVHAADEARPRVAVKLARSTTAEDGLRAEARALELLASRRPTLHGVPRLLFCRRLSFGLALAESAVRGRPLGELVTRTGLRDVALTATDWFSDLADRPRLVPRIDWSSRLIDPILDAFDGLPGPAIVPDLIARTRTLFAVLPDLPLTISHGDAGPTNVLMDEARRISVIDWEDCEPLGLPVGDLIVLLTYLIFHVEDPWKTGRFRQVYRATLDPTSEYGRLRLECLRRYADHIGLDASTTAPLAVVPWMQRSLREHQGMLDASLGSEGREAFRRGLYVSLWEEELRAAEQSAA